MNQRKTDTYERIKESPKKKREKPINETNRYLKKNEKETNDV